MKVFSLGLGCYDQNQSTSFRLIHTQSFSVSCSELDVLVNTLCDFVQKSVTSIFSFKSILLDKTFDKYHVGQLTIVLTVAAVTSFAQLSTHRDPRIFK